MPGIMHAVIFSCLCARVHQLLGERRGPFAVNFFGLSIAHFKIFTFTCRHKTTRKQAVFGPHVLGEKTPKFFTCILKSGPLPNMQHSLVDSVQWPPCEHTGNDHDSHSKLTT